MTEINKEKLMLEIVNMLKQTTKDFQNHVDEDLVHIDMGELSSYETIFNIVYSIGHISERMII